MRGAGRPLTNRCYSNEPFLARVFEAHVLDDLFDKDHAILI
jgi:hypothetical protein